MGCDLGRIFGDMGMQLEFNPISVYTPIPEDKSIIVPVAMRVLDFKEFCVEAKEKHGIEYTPVKDGNPLCIRRYGEIVHNGGENNSFLIEPFFGKGETAMVIGGYGSSKTAITKVFSMLCVTGQSLGNKFHVKKPVPVMCVDLEMPRVKVDLWDRKLTGGDPEKERLFRENYFSICSRELANKIDLSDPDTRNTIEMECKQKGVRLLVIDPYGRSVSTANAKSETGWWKSFSWFRRLNDAGINVCIVNHTTKAGDQRGPLKMSDDVDLVIKVEKATPERQKYFSPGSTVVEISIEKGRYLNQEQCEPFLIGYKEVNGIIETHVLDMEGKPFDRGEPAVTGEEIASAGLSDLEREILEKARDVYPYHIVAGDFKTGGAGRSSTTINEKLNRLVDLGLLERHGQNKGTRYTAVMQNNSSVQQE